MDIIHYKGIYQKAYCGEIMGLVTIRKSQVTCRHCLTQLGERTYIYFMDGTSQNLPRSSIYICCGQCRNLSRSLNTFACAMSNGHKCFSKQISHYELEEKIPCKNKKEDLEMDKKKFWIVFQLSCQNTCGRFPTLEAAKNQANQLANNENDIFVVMEALSAFRKPIPKAEEIQLELEK